MESRDDESVAVEETLETTTNGLEYSLGEVIYFVIFAMNTIYRHSGIQINSYGHVRTLPPFYGT